MSEQHAEDPVGQAGTKLAQYLSLATIAAEAIAQAGQRRTATAATADRSGTAAARAERAAVLATARARWAPVLDPRLTDRTGVSDAGLAWAAAQPWRDVDPEATLASQRATDRLRELRPDVMDRYDRLTSDGLDPVDAMRRVAPFLDRPPAQPGRYTAPPEPGGDQTVRSATHPSRPPAAEPTAAGHDPRGGDAGPGPHPATSARPQPAAPTAGAPDPAAASDPAPATALLATRTAPQLARDGFPEPLTGEVLAGGRVHPKAPATPGPASVRSVGLATAARAASSAR